MNYKIIEKELFGIKNPKVRIKIKSYSDIKKIQIFVNNKLYSNYNNSELKIINGLLEMNLRNLTYYIIIMEMIIYSLILKYNTKFWIKKFALQE